MDITFKTGDRVQYNDEDTKLELQGTVARVIPANEWHSVEVVVVEWDDDSRGTVWASDLAHEGTK